MPGSLWWGNRAYRVAAAALANCRGRSRGAGRHRDGDGRRCGRRRRRDALAVAPGLGRRGGRGRGLGRRGGDRGVGGGGRHGGRRVAATVPHHLTAPGHLEVAELDRRLRQGEDAIRGQDVARPVGEEPVLVVVDRSGSRAVDRDDPLRGPVADLEGRDLPVGDRDREATLVIGRGIGVVAVRSGDAGGAVGAVGVVDTGLRAAGGEEEQNEVAHAISEGGEPASRGAGLRQLPGNPGV